MLIDKLIKRVKALDLDLRGKTVLTELPVAPTWSPAVGCPRRRPVFAYTRTTRYGTVERFLPIKTRRPVYRRPTRYHPLIEKITLRSLPRRTSLPTRDTLRPLSREMLSHAKDSLVIPLMYEAWEWRDADMDIDYIRQRGFRIGATNERHPEVDVFNYLRDMALKQIFDAGITPCTKQVCTRLQQRFRPFYRQSRSPGL